MGGGHKIASVFFRVLELVSASVVAGLVGEYLHHVNSAGDHASSRLVYTVALAGISIIIALVCMIPIRYLFYGFLLDGALFVMWMVSFGLWESLTDHGGCNSTWYWSSWGYYWGGWYYNPVLANQSLVGMGACGKWRATQAWSFIGGFCFLSSALIGAYVVFHKSDKKRGRDYEGQFGDENIVSSRRDTSATQEIREVSGGDRVVNPVFVV